MTDCDWPEDAHLENGDYECKCCHCGATFTGHKRRVSCRKCSTPMTDLDRVMELLAKATPSEWKSMWTGRSGSGIVKPENRHHYISATIPAIPLYSGPRDIQIATMCVQDAFINAANAAAIIAAVNYLRSPEFAAMVENDARYRYAQEHLDVGMLVGDYDLTFDHWDDARIDAARGK